MNQSLFPLLVIFGASALFASGQAKLPELGLILDLDANHGVVHDEEKRVTNWQNQVKDFAAKDFVARDEGRAEKGSGRPTLRAALPELGGRSALAFLQQELVCLDEDAFDLLTKGGGATWISVMACREQRVGLEDVNSFFGNLKNGGNFEGVWGCLNDDNSVWWGGRNGISFGRFDVNNPKIQGPKLEARRFYIIAGRIAPGTGVVALELFVNNPVPVAKGTFPVNEMANPSVMAIGQERDAINHPGHESFDGDIARFLIWKRALSEDEMANVLQELHRTYQIKPLP